MKNFFFHPEAEEEMKASAAFYETKINGLGEKFLNEIDYALESISVSPEAWPIYFENIRRFLLRRFPFGILYEIRREYIRYCSYAPQEKTLLLERQAELILI